MEISCQNHFICQVEGYDPTCVLSRAQHCARVPRSRVFTCAVLRKGPPQPGFSVRGTAQGVPTVGITCARSRARHPRADSRVRGTAQGSPAAGFSRAQHCARGSPDRVFTCAALRKGFRRSGLHARGPGLRAVRRNGRACVGEVVVDIYRSRSAGDLVQQVAHLAAGKNDVPGER